MSREKPLRILLVDDEEIVHQTIGPYLRDLGHDVDETRDGNTALARIEASEYEIALIDIRMPGMDGLALLEKVREIQPELSAVIITGHGSMELAIDALRLGAADFLTKPIKLLELDAVIEKSIRIRELLRAQHRLGEAIRGIQSHRYASPCRDNVIGVSRAMQEVRNQIQTAVEARCDMILIAGETGTGKEIVAREIHAKGERKDNPFIAVSCPTLPDSLMESELFGHSKGAFTGADSDKLGCFELADGGTLFLDEIADLSSAAQSKVLRVLETRALRRVGGSKEIKIDIQVIAATNSALEKLVEDRKFRKDLYFRLNVFAIHLPPLRERREDILPLAEHFLSCYAVGRGFQIEGFSEEAREMLLGYDYPGNARELRNLVERATILCRRGRIQAGHLQLPASFLGPTPAQPPLPEKNERAAIFKALEETRWNRKEAAKVLGISYASLRYKMDKYRL